MLAKNRTSVEIILKILSPEIIGKKTSGFRRGYGMITLKDVEMYEIRPGGSSPDRDGKEAFYWLWEVRIREIETKKYVYSLSLADVIHYRRLEGLFKKFPVSLK